MKIIDKIEIKYLRSLDDVSVKGINHLNVFSGLNDSGKSNILKALNLFFNNDVDFGSSLKFEKDFSKKRENEVKKESIKGKKFISIKIYFTPPATYKSLPNKFYIIKIWDKDGKLLDVKNNAISLFKKGKSSAKTATAVKRNLSIFQNNIHFEYIPAVRPQIIFNNLLSLLQKIVVKKQRNVKSIKKALEQVNQENKKITEHIKKDFKNISGIDSEIKLPTDIGELFQTFYINTKAEDEDIALDYRGSGIQMRYIPSILNYIAKNTKDMLIWGFDEPENSCEYSMCESMAEDFKNVFCNNSQIFLTTHSFNFIGMKDKKISKYRVYKDEGVLDSKVVLIGDNGINNKEYEKIIEEMGFLKINEFLSEEYKKKKEEILKLNRIISEYKKPVLYVEGDIDIYYIKKAAEILGKKNIIENIDIFDANGAGGLDKIWKYFDTAISTFEKKKHLLLYDCDYDKQNSERGRIHRRIIPRQENKINKGIENLFSNDLVDRAIQHKEAFIDVEEIKKIVRARESKESRCSVNKDEKRNLCDWICKNATKDDFKNFSCVFEIIKDSLL